MDSFTERPFPRLFEDQAARDPNKTAVLCDAETLMFGELNARANQLARHLRSFGVGAESLVGICVERSAQMAAGILGILKAGGAYLPLDPEYPKERLAFMLEDARPRLLLTESKLASQVPQTATQTLFLDQDLTTISRQSDANLNDSPSPDDLAYVIYTSGSTGRPKGVMITHGNLANYLLALNHELHISRDDRYLHMASIAFSSSRRQLMLPLSQGATVVIATSEQRKDPLLLFEMIKQRDVTVMDAVPSFWRNCTLVLASLNTQRRKDLLENRLRLMLSASEPLASDILRRWISQFGHPARHVHMFGQTETAGIVSVYWVPPEVSEETKIVPIGRPIANSEIYILDEDQQLVADGEVGELCIGGAGVGRGYLNRAQLTAEKFIPHPFDDKAGARLYRTGDWARGRADGQIEFVGRRDQQVKLRGFRVELGEVEAALIAHPAIREGTVIARDDHDDPKLIAYFVLDGPAPTVSELRSFLSARLPEFAIPSAFVRLPELPLSANGKLNRLALPDPDGGRPELANDYAAPRTSLEKQLAEIWCEVLRVSRVGMDDHFFELGGHSLLAAQIMARVRNRFRTDLPLRVLFDYPTVGRMAEVLETAAASNQNLVVGSIEPTERNGIAPLSFAQQQFWLLNQSSPDNSVYNVNSAIRISGVLELPRLQQALEAIIAHQEVLRARIVVDDSGPAQIIEETIALPLTVLDLTKLPAHYRDAKVGRLAEAEARQPFDLAHGPLFRIRLLKLAEDDHILLLTIHHIICDGWSLGLWLRELAELYQSFREGRRSSLPELKIQYTDFARWQRQTLQGEVLEGQLDYWKGQLAGAPDALDLPTDYPRPEVQTGNGAQVSVCLPSSLGEALRSLGRREGVTLFMTLLAAFQSLLFRYSRQDDIVVGAPVAGRRMLETEGLIGAFVNTLVFRADASGNPTFREFLGRVRAVVLEALSHQDVPFERLVAELQPERASNRTPLFQVMFALQKAPAARTAIDGLTFTPLKLNRAAAKFDLTLEVEEEPSRLRATFEYNTNLFASATAERMLGHFQNVLAAIVADPTQRLADLLLLTDSERHKLLVELNDTAADFSEHLSIHQLFEAQVEKTPDAIAVQFQGRQLTYRQLNGRANQLARYLRKQGVGPESLVGICIERSLEMLAGILGVLKAGGAYVPLDPAYPRDRIAFMLEDAGLSLVVTRQGLTRNLPRDSARIVCLDKDWEIIAREADENSVSDAGPTNLAYVIYTSGSTGNPKGVMIEHRSLVNFIEAAIDRYAIEPGDRVLQFASLCFDVSAEEIFGTLLCGATLVLRTDEMLSSARDFLHRCDQWRVTVLDLPTAYWHELTEALSAEGLKLPASARLAIIGGEKASVDRVTIWKKLAGKNVRLMNAYGPTEITVSATICDLSVDDESVSRKNVSIGRPMRNTTAYVLDESLRPVPIGVPGELYIGGIGLARGYLNRPELTAEKFISNPFPENGNERLYKTGDLVRYRSDGNIEFLGRIDNQVKLRGFRIELEEIEEALRIHNDVADCVVVLREDQPGEQRLVAYLVPINGSPPAVTDLRNFLKTKLPSYMLPAAFAIIEALPLMPNGKIDRRTLPEPSPPRPELENSFVAPQSPIEKLLAAVWGDVLKLERVGVHDNFFELGGHSLLAARVVSNLRRMLDVELAMTDVFRAPTIAGLAALLCSRATQKEIESGLPALLEELQALTDEEARRRFDREARISEAAVA